MYLPTLKKKRDTPKKWADSTTACCSRRGGVFYGYECNIFDAEKCSIWRKVYMHTVAGVSTVPVDDTWCTILTRQVHSGVLAYFVEYVAEVWWAPLDTRLESLPQWRPWRHARWRHQLTRRDAPGSNTEPVVGQALATRWLLLYWYLLPRVGFACCEALGLCTFLCSKCVRRCEGVCSEGGRVGQKRSKWLDLFGNLLPK